MSPARPRTTESAHQMLHVNQTLNTFLGPRRFPRPRTATVGAENPLAPRTQAPENQAADREGDGATRHLDGYLEVGGSSSGLGRLPPTLDRATAPTDRVPPGAAVVASGSAEIPSVQSPGVNARLPSDPAMNSSSFQQRPDTAPWPVVSLAPQGASPSLPSVSRNPSSPAGSHSHSARMPSLAPPSNVPSSSESYRTSFFYGLRPESVSKISNSTPAAMPHVNGTTVSASLPSPTPTDEPSPAALGHIGSPQQSSTRLEAQPPPPAANMVNQVSGALQPQGRPASVQQQNELAFPILGPTASAMHKPHAANTTPANTTPTEIPTSRQGATASQQQLPAQMDGAYDLTAMSRALKDKKASLDAAALQHPVLRPRLEFLQQAIDDKDLFYVVLHQLWCAWSCSKQQDHPFLSISNDKVDQAFDILQSLLGPNSSLPQEHLSWFAGFPSNRRSALETSEAQRLRKEISLFLQRMSDQWHMFVQSLPIRAYPILMWEMRSMFCLESPTLQSILFIYSRRVMGIQDEEASRKLQDLFRKDRQATQAGLTDVQRQEVQSKLLVSYAQIVNAYRTAKAARQAQQSNSTPAPQGYWSQLQQQQQQQQPMILQQQPQRPMSLQQQQYFQQMQQQQLMHQRLMVQQPVQRPVQQQPQQPQQHQVAYAGGQPNAAQAQVYPSLQSQAQALSHPGTTVPTQLPQPLFIASNDRRPQGQENVLQALQVPPPQTHVQGQQQQIQLLQQQQQQQQLQPHHQQQHGGAYPYQHVQGSGYGPGTPTPAQGFMPAQGFAMPQQNIRTTHIQLPAVGGGFGYRQGQPSPGLPSPGLFQSPVSATSPVSSHPTSPFPSTQQQGAGHLATGSLNASRSSSGAGPGTQGRNVGSEQAGVANASPHSGPGPSYAQRQQINPANPGVTQPFQQVLNAPVRQPSALPPTSSPNPATVGAVDRQAHQTPQGLQSNMNPRIASQLPVMPRLSQGVASIAQPGGSGARVAGAFFPAPDQPLTLDRYPQSPFDPRSADMSLHQIHARSPRRIPLLLPGLPRPADGRYFQAVKMLAAGPTLVGSGSRTLVLEFDIAPVTMAKLVRKIVPPGADQPASGYFEGALRYRFRMCAVPANKSSTVQEDKWVTMPTSWPEHVFVTFNTTSMPIRRKTHNGMSQPVELTELVCLGRNSLQVSVLQAGKSKESVAYFAAIEVVETRGSGSVRQQVLDEGTIPATVTAKLVADRLTAAEEGGDDVVITDSTVSIDLSDPFTMRMFTVPVRGASCTHLECFDLDTWLATRTGKPICYHRGRQACEACRESEKLGPEPTLADAWKCPICSSDARPRSLRVDLFLRYVRDMLVREGKEAAKSISVNKDGSWTPRIEEEDAESDEDEPTAKRRRSEGTGKDKGPPPGVEVIELD